MASTLPETRRSLHAVAEQVLSAVLYQATGRIGLRPTPGGFGTPWFPGDSHDRQVRIEGTDLVVLDGPERTDERRAPLRTVAAAAALAGVSPGAPDIYPAATPPDPDRPLLVDPAAAAVIHEWFHTSAEALATFCSLVASPEPPVPQLWPEHFDLAVTIAEVNYGASPGDDAHDLPYAYVGPWNPRKDPPSFWNEPFGASRPLDSFPSTPALLAFFEQGHTLATTTKP